MKNSFLLYTEQRAVFEKLTDEQAGKLIKAIYQYADTGNLDGVDDLTNIIVTPFTTLIDKDTEKYNNVVERNRLNGQRGGRPKKVDNDKATGLNENPNNPVVFLETQITQDNPKKPKKADNEYDNDILLNSLHSFNNNIYSAETLKNTIKGIVDYLNEQAGTSYKYTCKNTQDKIKARLNENYTSDDFIAVIDKKVKEWKGTDYEKYLRPETLFGNKFESYLNQKVNNSDDYKKDTKDKKLSFQNYSQRHYDENDLDEFYDEL